MTMNISHRFYAVLLSIGFAALTACSNSNTPTEVAVDFSINGVKGTISGQNVTIDLTSKEACSDLTSLITGVQANGASISPDPTVARDYSLPVAFTITSPDGTKVVYTVTVKGNTCEPPRPVSPKECKADAIGSTGYSLVFKGCTADNVAEYYDKTECVRDNMTGLIWEGKTTSGLRSSTNSYFNLDSTTSLQYSTKYSLNNQAGILARSPTLEQINSPDNSIGYRNIVNTTNLCGASDWRMPTIIELESIRIPGATTRINSDWFVNTELNGIYATSTPFDVTDLSTIGIQFYGAGANQSIARVSQVSFPVLGTWGDIAISFVRLVRVP
jgi:Protein of unknown function (DUF1566)